MRLLGLDLVDEDHRVARDHADERQHAQDRDKPERLARQEQGGHNPITPSGATLSTRNRRLKP